VVKQVPDTMIGSGLPRIMHEAGAALLLVDLSSSSVVYANREATLMAGEQRLPMGIDEWSRRAGLLDVEGRDLSDSSGPLSRVARGQPVAGELVERDPQRAGAGQDEAGPDAETVETGPMWVTGFPLGAEDDSGLAGQALVVFMQVTGPPDRLSAIGALRDRAVVATGLAFTISDPNQPDDPLVWVNPAFTATTGYPLDQVLGRNCRFLQGPDTDPEAISRIREALHRRESVVETLLNYRADGTAFWNEVSISPVLDGEGRLVNFVGVQADVTARMEVQVERQRALVAERRSRARLALLADVAEAATELDSPVALQRVAETIVRGDLVGWCAFAVANGHLRVVATAGPVPPPGRDSYPLAQRDRDTPHDAVAAQVDGTVRQSVELAEAAATEGGVAAWLARQVCTDDGRRCLSLPVPGRRDVLGLLVVGAPEQGFDDDDLALLAEVARRVGLSMENARLYAREHQLAETLQRSMLPEQAGVPGLDVWSYYAPNVDHAQVGGDWYDVLQMGPDAVGLVIGDVVGHDVEAAAAMGQLRSVVRAYAFEQEEPGTVLMRVDQLVSGMRIPRSASLVLATLTRDGDAWELEWSRAGHLPPLLIGDGEVQVLSEAGGTLVGVGDRPRATATRRLEPGDVLVLYTDGLIERRSRPLMDGLQMLREVCGTLMPSDAAGIGEQLLTALGDEPEDDLAIVVLRVPLGESPVHETAGTPRQRRWQLPGDPTSIGRARRLTTQACAAWDLDCGPEAELVVSELVANSVLHGWGPVGLRLRHSARGLVIEVDDGNPAPPTPVESGRQAIGGYGMHVVQRLAEWGWHRSGVGKTVWARVPDDHGRGAAQD
jgi:PAS domain S-box-containing protein